MRKGTHVPAAWDLDWVSGDPPAAVPADSDAQPLPATAAGIESLPPRLQEVLHGLLAGGTEKAVADQLGLSPHTVHEYTKRLHRAFGVNSRAELLARFVIVPARDPHGNGERHVGGNGNGNGNGYSGNGNGHLHDGSNGNGSSNGNGKPPAVVAPEGLGADPAQHVDYCVQLLRKRGFMVRMAEAAEDLVNGRRGFVAAAMLLVLLGCMTAVSLMDSKVERPSDLRPAAGVPAPLLPPVEYPRRMQLGVSADGEWVEAGRAELWEVLEWQTDPPGEEALLRVGARELAPGVRHQIRTPGTIFVRSWGQAPRVVKVQIDQPATASAPAEALPTE